MSRVLETVDLRTRLAGRNRLELLLFELANHQRFGINVFKVREVIHCPSLTRLPDAAAAVRGIVNLRGQTMSVIDLNAALGGTPVHDTTGAFLIVTEYNRSIQGFLVSAVDRIINVQWEDIRQPPPGVGNGSYLTAVTELNERLVGVIDVEKVLVEVTGMETGVSDAVRAQATDDRSRKPILVVDDSAIARKQITRALEGVGIDYFATTNGREALELLHEWLADGVVVEERLSMIISDIEMPVMDGYTLTREVKQHPQLQNLFVLLHSSLSGVFNEAMVQQVGADRFLAKFKADELVSVVLECTAPTAPTSDAA